MKTASSGSRRASAPAAEPRIVAYHDGPPEITFFGRTWRRGVAQPVSELDWRDMSARGDFREFDFRTAGAEGASANNEEKE